MKNRMASGGTLKAIGHEKAGVVTPAASVAERRGFEPRIPFWSIHAFQACALSHSATSPDQFDFSH